MSNKIIENFLLNEAKNTDCFEYMFGVDNNQNSKDEWKNSKLKVLCVFLTPGPIRASSCTFITLNHTIKSKFGSDVFVDYCYLPYKNDIKVFKNSKLGFLFGNVSHEFWQSYDLVCISFAIISEIYNLPFLFSFNDIPFGYNQRMSDQSLPIISAGGICSPMLDILYGDVSDTDHCMLDFVYVGHAEVGLNNILTYLIENKTLQKKEKLFGIARTLPYTYVPAEYKYDWELNSETGYKINSITHPEGFPDKIHYAHFDNNMQHVGFEHKVLNASGEDASTGCYDISSGCSGSGACSFCFEGSVGGKFKDRDLDLVKSRLTQLKKTSAPNTITFFSYNSPYYYRFIDLLYYAASNFSNLSILNLRMDCIAANPDILKVGKLLGLKRISGAIEGIGPRLRNGFLNKNVSFDQIQEFFKIAFRTNLADIKVGMIFTGHETKDDFDASVEEFRQIIAIREQIGVNTSLRITVTPLVYYPHTPTQRKKKQSSLAILTGDKPLDYYMAKIRELGIRIKINSRSLSTWMEQFLTSYGRVATKFLIAAGSNNPLFYGYLTKESEQSLLNSFSSAGIDFLSFLNEIPVDNILWHDPIQCIPPSTQKRADINMSNPISEIKPVRFCTVSPANPPNKSSLDKSIKASCNGCGICKSSEEIDSTINRSIQSEHSIDDFAVALQSNKSIYMTVLTLNKFTKFSYVSSVTMQHILASKILGLDDSFIDSYHSLGKSNLSLITKNNQRDWTVGKIIYPIYWKSYPDISAIDISKINKEFESFDLVSISSPDVSRSLFHTNDFNMFGVFLSGYTKDIINTAYNSFDGNIPMASKSRDRTIVPILASHGSDIYMSAKDINNGVMLVFTLRLKFNPIMFLSGLLNESYLNLLRRSVVKCFYTFRFSDRTCKVCSAPTVISLNDGKVFDTCPQCLTRVIISNL